MVFPRIRLQGFFEHRLRTPVRGSLLGEETDVMLTEPIVPQLRRWLSAGDNMVFAPVTNHVSTDIKGCGKLVSICYLLLKSSKADAVQQLYGT